jgi:spermidine synthase
VTAVSTAGERSPLPLRFLLALLAMGFTELIAQVILTRELLANFFGNELSIALVLAVWLVAVAAGSAGGSRLAPRLTYPDRAFGWAQMLLAAVFPLALLTARLLQPGHPTPGQVLGPGAMLLTSCYALAPVCVVGGYQFVLAARAAAVQPWRPGRREDGAVAPIALVYALEAVGAVVGGVAFHFWMAEHVAPFQGLALVGLLNIASGCALLRPRGRLRAAGVLVPAALLSAALLGLVLRAEEAELASLRRSPRWANLHPVDFVPSRYGPLVVSGQANQVSFFQSGVLLFTSQDEYANEVVAHLPLLEHPLPRRVLVIGGAVAGLAGEVLKHPVDRLDCVELDPSVVGLARRWLPRELLGPLSDRRANFHLGDGRLFAKQARDRYDVMIVNLPDPTTASLNRFYTVDFFREARQALAPGGVLAVSLTGSSHHLSGSVLLAAAVVDESLGRAFADRLVVPGEEIYFMAATEPGVLSAQWQVLAERLDARGVRTDFVNEAWLRDALLPFRAELIRAQFEQAPGGRINSDLEPVSYYYQTRVWLDQLSPVLARPMRLVSRVAVWWALVPILAAVVAVAVTRGRGRPLSVAAVLTATAFVGGFGLLVEVLALLAFQSACGYLYHALAALIAAFMGGIAAGSAGLSLREVTRRAACRLLIGGLATSLLICLLLPPLVRAVLPAPALAPLALGILLFLVGSLVGALFPVAVLLYRQEQAAAAAGGIIYAADLVGSAGAAVIAGTIVVPLLGFVGASRAAALLLAAALVLSLPLLRGGRPQVTGV